MNFLPVGINVKNKRIIMIGGGNVALQKLRVLITTSAKIQIYADNVCQEIRAMSNLQWSEQPYEEKLLKGAFLVYACTNDRELNRRIAVEAREQGALVNTADDPANCDFTSLALWTQGNLTVAVSSDAKDTKHAVELRNKIRDVFINDSTAG